MISACLITKNEEAWIGGLIDHLRPIVTEFIIVDTGSTDRTVEIARAKGARVSQIKWENDFAKARNLSLDKATQRWILVIDPDERLADIDLPKIQRLCGARDVQAYSFNTRNYVRNPVVSNFVPNKGEYSSIYEKDYPGYFESRKVRLFQNIPTTRFVGSVHELVESTIKGRIVESDIPFHHYGSAPEVDAQKGKKTFYQQQGQQKVQEQPNDWKAHFELGIEYIGAKEFKKAIVSLQKAHELSPKDPLIMSNLGYALMESNQLDQAEVVLKDCLKVAPKHHDAGLNLGVVAMRRQKYDMAIKIFGAVIKIHPNSFLAYRNAGLSFAHVNKLQEAARCFESAIKIFPAYTEARIDLGLVCFAAGKADLAKPMLEEALKQNPQALRARAVLDEIEKAKSLPPQKQASSTSRPLKP